MTFRILAFTVPVFLLFYCVIPSLYLFPRIAENKAVGTAMLMVAFLVVGPTWVAIVIRVCSLGLRTGGIYRPTGIQV
jgi:hypothetical protein